MKKDKIYYTEFHVAGVQYHEAIEVMSVIKVGDKVRLVRDEDNKYDPNAVAIFYGNTHIGYVPRTDTDKFTTFIDMGWNDLFEARICRIKHDVHYEDQLHVQVKILQRNQDSRIQRETTYMPQNSKEITPDEKHAIDMWSNVLGDSNKFLNGENPMPSKSKIATAESWSITPMDPDHRECEIQMYLSISDMDILRHGHIPEVMEDHWFMFVDDEHIRYFRSWTGLCVFEAHYIFDGTKYIIDHLNIDKNNYNESTEAARKLFKYLVVAEVGGDVMMAWKEYERAIK